MNPAYSLIRFLTVRTVSGETSLHRPYKTIAPVLVGYIRRDGDTGRPARTA